MIQNGGSINSIMSSLMLLLHDITFITIVNYDDVKFYHCLSLVFDFIVHCLLDMS